MPVLTNRSTKGRPEQSKHRLPGARLDEVLGLAAAIDLDVRTSGAFTLSMPRPATLIGKGKLEELSGFLRADDVELVVLDHVLSPVQQRNLERVWKVKVLDRTGLILEIFGRRARTKEGRLQVELAHLNYQRSRLVRSWTHLERQRGGFGFMGGPGETQIEADRRLILQRIATIQKELETVKRTRGLHRSGRARVPYPVVALVGYTNAGKSTLFNRLTEGDVVARDQLFATLDPTMREIQLVAGRRAIVSDTVGFISDLPTTLIAAFRATLEEVVEADLILHVRDIAHPDTDAQRADVDAVLAELGIDLAASATRIIEVWNKIDLLDQETRERDWNTAQRLACEPVMISAKSGEGLASLTTSIDAALATECLSLSIELAPQSGALSHWIHENAEVVERQTDATGRTNLQIRIPTDKSDQLLARISQDQWDSKVLAQDSAD